ncbi:acyl-CoA dehydrogenase, N-terminal domain protein [Mycobacterium xenopi 4042]|uniref:Acyl-CoA dehydrogenase, N-terminal domain protein n=1 Tax=Mycobacterium xenopi 4042 TaxID=1299334 RepID=X8AMY0_MYCXE|nr:acyl-CoA dehydrogenase, N-terminal domain protein [Mycobacterium xenopi 3993]EUA33252.1 acyl-CoA dehydrogenase, N-terminal domain protein [Mycobacterium xenopi 4042]
MDFQLSDEQALLRDTTRDVLARSYDAESRNKIVETDLGWSREVWSQLADVGILGLGFDPDEAGQIEIMLVLIEIGRRLAPNLSSTPRWARARSSPNWVPPSKSGCSTMSLLGISWWRLRTSSPVAMQRRGLCDREIRGR